MTLRDFKPLGSDDRDPIEDLQADERVEAVVTWLVSQVEHVLRHPLLGRLAKHKIVDMIDNFEIRLKGLGISPEMTGVILQQTYDRIKRLLKR